ncbi:MAG: hypothetical protein JKY54_17480 [Flavobacteriales bacterium]|nr:hypothetical protein [Flavobacteriales bacterium]
MNKINRLIKNSFTLLILLCCLNSFAQFKESNFSIGSGKFGIGFGDFNSYSGLRFSWYGTAKQMNGIDIGLDLDTDFQNGLSISIIGAFINKRSNGINAAVLYNDAWVSNGISIGGLVTMHDQLRGVCFGGIGAITRNTFGVSTALIVNVTDHQINGVAFGGIVVKSEELYGVTLGTFNINNLGVGTQCGGFNFTNDFKGFQIGCVNRARQLSGLQFGLINVIRENKHFKVMPILNFNFSKKCALEVTRDSIGENGEPWKIIQKNYSDGSIKSEILFHYQESISEKRYYDSGKLKETFAYKDSLFHGAHRSYSKSGELMDVTMYQKGRASPTLCSKGYLIYDCYNLYSDSIIAEVKLKVKQRKAILSGAGVFNSKKSIRCKLEVLPNGDLMLVPNRRTKALLGNQKMVFTMDGFKWNDYWFS